MSNTHTTLESAPYPYPGLRAFRDNEHSVFFGRSGHVEAIEEKLLANRFLAVVGPSGCGKSSLVRAGLIPKLSFVFQDEFRFIIARPGNDPLRNLARAICDSVGRPDEVEFFYASLSQDRNAIRNYLEMNGAISSKYLIIIDQFEEIFRYKDDDGERPVDESEARKFVKAILNCLNDDAVVSDDGYHSIHLMLTMRSDFLGACAEFENLAEQISDSQFLTPRMSREQLRQAIVGPATVFGFEFEPLVVNRILNEVGDKPDQLPVMQHLLMRLWRLARHDVDRESFSSLYERNKARSKDVVVSMEQYEQVGGIKNALDMHGNSVLQRRLDEHEGLIAQFILKSLTTIDKEGRAVRNPRTLGNIFKYVQARLATPKYGRIVKREVFDQVINELRREGRTFIFPHMDQVGENDLQDDTGIDITHEGLIRNWSELTDWTRKEHKRKKTETEVRELAKTWKRKKRSFSELLRGAKLEEARKWMSSEFGLENRDFAKQESLENRKTDFRKVPKELRDFLWESERASELFKTSEKLNSQINQKRKVLARVTGTVIVVGLLAGIVLVKLVLAVKSEAEEVENQKIEIADQKTEINAQQVEINHQQVKIHEQKIQIGISQTRERFNSRFARSKFEYPIGLIRFLNGISDNANSESNPERKIFFQAEFGTTAKDLFAWLVSRFDHSVDSKVLATSAKRFNWCATSNDANWIAFCGFDNLVHVVKRGGETQPDREYLLPGHVDKVYQVVFSPNNEFLASCSADNRLIIWKLSEADPPQEFYSFRARDRIYSVALTNDYFAIGDGAGRLYVSEYSKGIKNADAKVSERQVGNDRIFQCQFGKIDDRESVFALSLDGTFVCMGVEGEGDNRPKDANAKNSDLLGRSIPLVKPIGIDATGEMRFRYPIGNRMFNRDAFFLEKNQNDDVSRVHVVSSNGYVIFQPVTPPGGGMRLQGELSQIVIEYAKNHSDIDFGFRIAKVTRGLDDKLYALLVSNINDQLYVLPLKSLKGNGEANRITGHMLNTEFSVDQIALIGPNKFAACLGSKVFVGHVRGLESDPDNESKNYPALDLRPIGQVDGELVSRMTRLGVGGQNDQLRLVSVAATGDSNGVARVWTEQDRGNKSIVNFELTRSASQGAGFSKPQNKHFIKFGDEKILPSDLYSPNGNEKLRQAPNSGSDRFLSACYSPNFQFGLATEYSGNFLLFNLDDEKDLPEILLREPCPRFSRVTAFSNNSEFFAVGSSVNRVVGVYRTASEGCAELVCRVTDIPSASLVAVSDDGNMTAIVNDNRDEIWIANSGKASQSVLDNTACHASFLTKLDGSPAKPGGFHVESVQLFTNTKGKMKSRFGYDAVLVAFGNRGYSKWHTELEAVFFRSDDPSSHLRFTVPATFRLSVFGRYGRVALTDYFFEYIDSAVDAFWLQQEGYEESRDKGLANLFGRNLRPVERELFRIVLEPLKALEFIGDTKQTNRAFPNLLPTHDQIRQTLSLISCVQSSSSSSSSPSDQPNANSGQFSFVGEDEFNKSIDAFPDKSFPKAVWKPMLLNFAKAKALNELSSKDDEFSTLSDAAVTEASAQITRLLSNFNVQLKTCEANANENEKKLLLGSSITKLAAEKIRNSFKLQLAKREFRNDLRRFLSQEFELEKLNENRRILEENNEAEWVETRIRTQFNQLVLESDAVEINKLINRFQQLKVRDETAAQISNDLIGEYQFNLNNLEFYWAKRDLRTSQTRLGTIQARLVDAIGSFEGNQTSEFSQRIEEIKKLSGDSLQLQFNSPQAIYALAKYKESEGRETDSLDEVLNFLKSGGLEPGGYAFNVDTFLDKEVDPSEVQQWSPHIAGVGFQFNHLFKSPFDPKYAFMNARGRGDDAGQDRMQPRLDAFLKEAIEDLPGRNVDQEYEQLWNSIGRQCKGNARQLNNIAWNGCLYLDAEDAELFYQIARQCIDKEPLSYTYRDTLGLTMVMALQQLEQRIDEWKLGDGPGQIRPNDWLGKRLIDKERRREFLELAKAQFVYFINRSSNNDHIETRIGWIKQINQVLENSDWDGKDLLEGMIDFEVLRNE